MHDREVNVRCSGVIVEIMKLGGRILDALAWR